MEVALLVLETGEIRDVKFVDDEFMMILWSSAGECGRTDQILLDLTCLAECSKILSVPYNPSSGSPACLKYQAWHQEGMDMVGQDPFAHAPSISLSEDEVTSTYARHTFPADSFKPARMEINGRKGRRVICVLSKDGLRYKIFDLGSGILEESSDEQDKGDHDDDDSGDGNSDAHDDDEMA